MQALLKGGGDHQSKAKLLRSMKESSMARFLRIFVSSKLSPLDRSEVEETAKLKKMKIF